MNVEQLHENIQRSLVALRDHEGNNVKFAERIGESKQTVGHWVNGKNRPDIEKLAEIAALYRIPLSMIINGGVSESKIMPQTFTVEVPLFGRIAAGQPLEMDAVDSTFGIPQAVYDRYPKAFLLTVEGDSMNRAIPNGSYALINPVDEVTHDGAPYAICVNGYDATIKRVHRLNNGFELIPDSIDPTYQTKTYNYNEPGTETITVIGEVVWYTLPYDWSF